MSAPWSESNGDPLIPGAKTSQEIKSNHSFFSNVTDCSVLLLYSLHVVFVHVAMSPLLIHGTHTHTVWISVRSWEGWFHICFNQHAHVQVITILSKSCGSTWRTVRKRSSYCARAYQIWVVVQFSRQGIVETFSIHTILSCWFCFFGTMLIFCSSILDQHPLTQNVINKKKAIRRIARWR